MRRFFTDPEHITRLTATLTGQEAKHIRQVLRLELDEHIELFDGTGSVYLAQIKSIAKQHVETEIIKCVSTPQKPPFLYVGQSLLKGKKMDFLYQKLTELSVEGLYPFLSQFSETKPRQNKQNQRWERISLEACKQCKRPTVMQCFSPKSFTDLLEKSNMFANKLLFWENEDVRFLSSLPEMLDPSGSTIILLGPEGGFSREEVQQARAKGFTTVSLGPRVLRAETAAVTATSIIQHMMGTFSRIDTINWEST